MSFKPRLLRLLLGHGVEDAGGADGADQGGAAPAVLSRRLTAIEFTGVVNDFDGDVGAIGERRQF